MKDRLIDAIVDCIKEYETREHKDIRKLYGSLQSKSMYPCLLELKEIGLN